jgi:hypothetical protein
MAEKSLDRFVRDETVGLVEPFHRRRGESRLDLACVVPAEEELAGLKTNTHIGLCSAGIASIE